MGEGSTKQMSLNGSQQSVLKCLWEKVVTVVHFEIFAHVQQKMLNRIRSTIQSRTKKWLINLNSKLLFCFLKTCALSRVFRSTLCNIPQTQSLLNKAKMPLGLLLHPFKDLSVTPQFNIWCAHSSQPCKCETCCTQLQKTLLSTKLPFPAKTVCSSLKRCFSKYIDK